MKNFRDFKLDEQILKTLDAIGYQTPTPIQMQAIPEVLAGSDLIASAQTGTGKTAAFLLPSIQVLLQQKTQSYKGPRVLILVPTRELAMQVAGEAEKFCKGLQKTRTVCIYGGVPYPIQKRSLLRPHDILVATPGRLIDHLEQGRIDLSNIQMLILDEADRMLDMGFVEDVETIAEHTPAERQTLLFSATMDRRVLSMSRKLQKNPVEISIKADHSLKANIEQRLYYVDNIQHKIDILSDMLEKMDYEQALVFTSTKMQADKLSDDLREAGHYTAALHGDMNQSRRTQTINKLRTGKIRILVATDVAARGIDVASLSHVINFDLPFQPEDFIHRIGRTGRAGASGTAITFATYREEPMLSRISKLTGKPMETHVIVGLEPKPKPAAQKFGMGSRKGGNSFSSRRSGPARPFKKPFYAKGPSKRRVP